MANRPHRDPSDDAWWLAAMVGGTHLYGRSRCDVALDLQDFYVGEQKRREKSCPRPRVSDGDTITTLASFTFLEVSSGAPLPLSTCLDSPGENLTSDC
jgi:hypothetical protein